VKWRATDACFGATASIRENLGSNRRCTRGVRHAQLWEECASRRLRNPKKGDNE